MKKSVVWLMAGALMLSVTACGGKETASTAEAVEEEVDAELEEEETEEETEETEPEETEPD